MQKSVDGKTKHHMIFVVMWGMMCCRCFSSDVHVHLANQTFNKAEYRAVITVCIAFVVFVMGFFWQKQRKRMAHFVSEG